MIDSGLLALIHNAALLLSMVLMFEMLVRQGWERAGLASRLLVGALLGSIGMAVMLTRWELLPGLVFDTRSILLATSGLFFGGVPTLAAMAMTAGLRILQGGIGTAVGIAVILASGLIGLGWRRWLTMRRLTLTDLTLWEAYAFGLVVHGAMLLCMLILPWPMALEVLARISLPVLAIDPIATLLLIVLMAGNLRKARAESRARAAQAETMRLLEQADRASNALQRVIEDERAARTALAENEQRLRSLINSTPDIICFKDGRGRWLEANDADLELFALSAVDYRGKTDAELAAFTHPIYSQAFLTCVETDEKAWRTVGISRAEERIPKSDGGEQVYDVIKIPLFERDGTRKALIVLGREITERKRTETALRASEARYRALSEVLEQRVSERTAALESANRELESFTYSVSHDLRAPLRAITGFTQILARRQRDRLDEEGRHYLDNVLEAGQRMESLIEDLLDYSRTGRDAVRRQPVALGPIVASLIATFGERIQATGALLEVCEPLATPLGDPTLIGQIVNNLIDNALLYRCQEDIPRIDLESRRQDGRVVISVSDNGIGIDPDEHVKIFQVFQRLHGQDEYPGTGVGLAIVTKAAHLMGGEIRLESTPGQGSRFSVSLPACPEDRALEP
jgi:PAS domain S-box-containing protein